MTRKFMRGVTGAAAAAVLAISLATLVPNVPVPDGPETAVLASSSTVGSGGSSEGIKVHGHWVIDIRDAEGVLVSHHEFENALSSGGVQTLVLIGSRQVSIGPWRIEAEGTYNYLIYESINGGNLIVQTTGGQTGLRLSGSVTAAQAGAISTVKTWVTWCSGNTSPATCAATPSSIYQQFTETTLSTPINVQQGQSIQVTVNIKFS